MNRPLTSLPTVVDDDLPALRTLIAPTASARDGRDDRARDDRDAAPSAAADAGSIEYASWFPAGRD